jgi:uncharacterized protein (TIGR01777 family)
MQIAVTGCRGLVGSAVLPVLAAGGHRVTHVVRGEARGDRETSWDPAHGLRQPDRLEGLDAVVHLAGESIATGRWTPERKAAIRQSRVEGTRRLSENLARLAQPPRVLVCASAVGYYGDRGEESLREESSPGHGFLAEVCQEWEASAEPAVRAGIRVVHLRFGMILSPTGGALKRMLLPFRLGLGGAIGTGRQFLSWIAIDDAIGAIVHALSTESLRGPVNVVAPTAITNTEFTRALARVLSRPAVATLPAAAARIIFGEMAEELLLASARVLPARLQDSGYAFRFSELEGALRHLLRRPL